MTEITTGEFKGKFLKLIPSRMVKSPKSFFQIEGNDMMYMMESEVSAVYQIIEKGGQPVINVKNKQPVYSFKASTKFTALPRDDYNTLINSRYSD